MRKLLLLSVAVAVFPAGTVTAYVNYEYYEGTWDILPDFDSLTPMHTGMASNFDLRHRNKEDNFGFRFRGIIEITDSGEYQFFTVSDDGSQLFINDALIVNNDGLHGLQERSGRIFLVAGRHVMEVTYFEKGGSNELFVLYEGPKISRQIIPASILTPIEIPDSYASSCPFPPQEAEAVDPACALNWMKPTLTANPQYNVYFAMDPNFPMGPRVIGQTVSVYDPFGDNSMAPGTKYYWRVDVLDPNEGGTPKLYSGERWSFTTRYGHVALYEFEVDPNDSTGNGHGGTYMGPTDPNSVQDSYRGNVLLLNANGRTDQQYVEIGSVGISGNAARTIAGWARASTTAISAWTNVFGFAHDGAGDNTYFDVEINSSGQYVLHVYGSEILFCPVDTEWHFFAATYDGALITVYLDGRVVGTGVKALATIDAFRIGSRRSHKTYFPGFVDEIAIWDYALTAEEIRRLILFADYDRDKDVDSEDFYGFTSQWMDTTIIPNSIKQPFVMEDFEKYSPTGFPPITMGWFVYLSDSKLATATFTLLPGQTETPYGGEKAMRFDYTFPAWTGDDWLTVGHRISPFKDMRGYDEIRFRVKYHSTNTEDVGLFFHVGDDPADVTEREAVRAGPFSTLDNVNDPNQWHEIVIPLRDNPNVQWQSPYTGIDEVRNMNGILVSVVNSSKAIRKGTLYFDDIRLVDHTPDCDGLPVADFTADCLVDMRDFVFLAEEWLRGIGL